MCHFLPVYHLGIAFLGWVEDQNITSERLQWTNETHFFISLILFSKRPHYLVVNWEIDGETYTQRGDFFPYLLPGARVRQRLHPSCKLVWDASDRLRIPRSTAILCLWLNMTAWFSSRGLLPVIHLLYTIALIELLFTNQNLIACQKTRVH